MKINLGCGKDIKKGYINIDSKEIIGVDIVHNIEQFPYPFKSESIEEIYASHILEHVTDLESVMQELHRILKKNGKIIVRVPHFTNSGAFADPTHKRFFTTQTFNYFLKNHPLSYYFNYSFKKVDSKIIFGKKFALWNYLLEPVFNTFKSGYENTFLRAFPAMEIIFKIYK
jgi:predicted SAM-dependent methyltransferase